MDFYAVLDQVLALLRSRGRVTYGALKRQCNLDDAFLDEPWLSSRLPSVTTRPRPRRCWRRWVERM
jgi:hypothetical protein